MYTNFRIQNFRGFKDLELKDLARVNLIAGKNNAGKTSILEALFLLMNPVNAELFYRINAIRGRRRIEIDSQDVSSTPMDNLFNNFKTENPINLFGVSDTDESYEYEIAVQFDADEYETETVYAENINQEAAGSIESQTNLPIRVTDMKNGKVYFPRAIFEQNGIRYVIPNIQQRHPSYYFPTIVREGFDTLAKRYTKLVKESKQDLVLKAMQTIEPNITSMQILYENGEPLLTADVGIGKPMPLIYMGEGVVRLLQFILAIGNAENGIVLIDEVENGFHYSIMSDIWRRISETAEIFNTQIIATTHSLEMIRSAQQAFANTGEDDFRYYRIDRHHETDDPLAVKYTQKTMDAAMEMGYEVRG